MGDFDVLLVAIFPEPGLVLCLDDDSHPFLGFADGEFGGIHPAVFDRHPVKVDVQSVGQFADGDADSAGSEVVGLLDQRGHFRTPEQPFQLPFFRGVALLDLAPAGLQGLLGVLLGGTRRPSDAVPAGTASQHQHYVSGSRPVAPDVACLDRTDHGPHFHPLGRVAFVEDLADVCGGKTDLVAVAGISLGGFPGDHLLGQFPRQGLSHALVDVARSCHPHGLVDIGTSRQGIPDGPSQAGGGPSERFYLGRVVVGLVLEHKQPPFGPAVVPFAYLNVNEYAAGVVFLADFHVVEKTLGTKVPGPDRGHVHEVYILRLPPGLLPHLQVEAQGLFYVLSDERVVDVDPLEAGGESRVAAVVAPVGVQDPQFGLIGVAALLREVAYHLAQVLSAHRQAHIPAESFSLIAVHLPEAFQHRDRFDRGLLSVGQLAEVLRPGLHGVDVVAAYLFEGLFRDVPVQDQQF